MPLDFTGKSDSGGKNGSANDQVARQQAFSGAFPVETSRLIIREIEAGDADSFHDLVTHPDFFYYYFDGERKTTEAFIAEALEGQNALARGDLRKNFMMAVIGKPTGELVGHVTVDMLDKAPDDYDLAYFIHPKHQGKGYATEAVRGFLKSLFSALAPPRVVATAHPDNIPSRRLLKSVGFVETGEVTRIESADGKGERLWYALKPEDFRQ